MILDDETKRFVGVWLAIIAVCSIRKTSHPTQALATLSDVNETKASQPVLIRIGDGGVSLGTVIGLKSQEAADSDGPTGFINSPDNVIAIIKNSSSSSKNHYS
jgi:hypothetical protein